MGTQQHAGGGYRQKIKQKFNQEYSPEPRDIYFTVPNLISVLRIASIPFIAWLVADHRMVPALIVLAVRPSPTASTASSRAPSIR